MRPLLLDGALRVLFPTRLLLGVWGIVSAMEWWANLDLFSSLNLLSWEVMSLRTGRLFRSRAGGAAFSSGSLIATLTARTAAVIVLFATSKLLTMSLALVAIFFRRG